MEPYFETGGALSFLMQVWTWMLERVFTFSTLVEGALAATILLLVLLFSGPLKKKLEDFCQGRGWMDRAHGKLARAIIPIVPFLLIVLFLRVILVPFQEYDLASGGLLLDLAARLFTAWIIIRFTTSFLRDSRWSRLIAGTAWTIAALHILGLLPQAIELLDQIGINLGAIRVSLLLLIKGVIVFTVLLRLALGASSLLEKRLLTLDDLTPSVQVLLTKALKITLLVVAVVAALSSLGINLSAFAFIGGAVGVGIGFGLQKVVSNLISGVILLLDKSIKPGDVIKVGDSYGRIHSLGARYVSVITRDGFEYLIPNENLITQQVVNWSFSDKLVRLKIGVGVSYSADIHQAMKLMVEVASSTPRVLDEPAPTCQLKNFGDSSVDLELRLWIGDPENGISNVASKVRIGIWDTFQAHNVEIPFPQRDIHIRSKVA